MGTSLASTPVIASAPAHASASSSGGPGRRSITSEASRAGSTPPEREPRFRMRATGIVPALHGAPLRDCDGVAVGAVEQLLSDAATHRPAWLVVRLDDGRRTVAPAVRARPSLHGTRVPWPETTLRSCPVTLGGHELDHARALRACRHYGVALCGATRSAQDA